MHEIYDTLEKIVAYLYAHGEGKLIHEVNGQYLKPLIQNEQLKILVLGDLKIKLREITSISILQKFNLNYEQTTIRTLEIFSHNELKATTKKFLGGMNKSYRGTLTISEKIPPKDWEIDDRYLDLFRDISRSLEEKYKQELDKQQ